MANFGEIMNKVTKTVGQALDKTAETVGDLTQKGKYKLEINKYEGEIKTIKSQLGKTIIDARLGGQSNEDLGSVIDVKLAKVQSLQEEIERVKKLSAELGEPIEDEAEIEEVEAEVVEHTGCGCKSDDSESSCACKSSTVDILKKD